MKIFKETLILSRKIPDNSQMSRINKYYGKIA